MVPLLDKGDMMGAVEDRVIRGMDGLRAVLEEMRKERVRRRVLVMGLAAYFGRAAEVVRIINPDLLVVLRVSKEDPFYTEEYEKLYNESGIKKLVEGDEDLMEELKRFVDMAKEDVKQERARRASLPFKEWPEIASLISRRRYVEIERSKTERSGFELFSDVRKVLLLVDSALGENAEKYVDITNFPLMGRIASVLVASTVPNTRVIYMRSSREVRKFSLDLYGPALILEEGGGYSYVDHPSLEIDELTRAILVAMYVLVSDRLRLGIEELADPGSRDRFLEEDVRSTDIRDLLLGKIRPKSAPAWWDHFLEDSKQLLQRKARAGGGGTRGGKNIERNIGIGISNKLHDLERMGLLRVYERPTKARFTEFGYEVARTEVYFRSDIVKSPGAGRGSSS